jgi:hypothetical protein
MPSSKRNMTGCFPCELQRSCRRRGLAIVCGPPMSPRILVQSRPASIRWSHPILCESSFGSNLWADTSSADSRISPLTNRPATRPEVIVAEQWLPNDLTRLGNFEQDDALIMKNHLSPIHQSNRVGRANIRQLRHLSRLFQADINVDPPRLASDVAHELHRFMMIDEEILRSALLRAAGLSQ